MLKQAHDNFSKLGLNIPLIKADYRELPQHFNRKFDAVMCLSTAIGEMPDETEVIRAFNSMYQVLNKGGILVLTQGTTDKQWAEKPRFLTMVNTRDFSRVCVIDYLEKGARYNILDIFHSNEVSDFKVWSIDYLQILLRDDFDKLLREAGFKVVEFYGTYDFDRYEIESSSRLIVVAHS
jgi:ubiquinone/menaquinone biosynthesis C-methylase UbiE